MKNMKTNKVQVLAALALAFSLGLAMPSAVFASEENAGEPAPQSNTAEDSKAEGDDKPAAQSDGVEGANKDGDGTGDKEEVLDLPESVVELYSRIQKRETFKNYRAAEKLVGNTINVKKDSLRDATDYLKHVDISIASGGGETTWAWDVVSQTTKNAVKDKKVYEVLDVLKADAAYTSNAGYKSVVDNITALVQSETAEEVKQVKALFPDLTNVDTMTLDKLVETAESLPNYEKFEDLYTASVFLFGFVEGDTTDEATTIDLAELKEAYKGEAGEIKLLLNYNELAKAAVAIDDTVMSGLADWKLPTTSTGTDEEKPKVPETGIIGLIESGAVDLGTVTLIVSAIVAGLAGAGLIAKLYLKHKF